MNPKRRLQQRLQQHLQQRLQRLRHSSLLHLSSHLSKHLSSHLSMHLSSLSLPRLLKQHISVPPFVVFYRKISAIIVYVVVHNCVLRAILHRCVESQRREENPLRNGMSHAARGEDLIGLPNHPRACRFQCCLVRDRCRSPGMRWRLACQWFRRR